MATYIKIDGTESEVKPANGKFFVYKELQDFVKDGENGMVEIVPMPSGKLLIGNEESKLIGLAKNERATDLWKKEYPIDQYPHNNDELICGNVLIVNESELEQ